MKRILFALVLCVMSMNVFAQKYYQYSELYISNEVQSGTWKYHDENGIIYIKDKKEFSERFGEYVEFKSAYGLLDFLALKGWEVVTYSSKQSGFSCALRKEVTKEELVKIVEKSKKK